ncbi:PilW family protein [Parendozoicomonas haliclonae]|uniref:Type IV pilus assembly protein PilW n=1 Tax=Parendozoicomonas haliclonae TaxID=1960125 RepID=A0A1X7APX0_9GAMM|nr:PilW family protein [Parendozoicomonas haliclonae]SMA50371.1 hypothetical protein EHSB41UT_04168 [Parendozoicomonas haliclonae]
MNRQQGSLVIEVMVSTLIGTLLLYGAISILLTSKQTFIASQGLSRIEERGRLALEILSEDIRMAGYRGCVSSGGQQVINTISATPDWRMEPEVGIRGWEFSGTNYGDELDVFTLSESAFSSSTWAGGTSSVKGTGIDMLRNSDVLQLWVAQPYLIDINMESPLTVFDDDGARLGVASMEGMPADDDENHDRFMVVSDCSRNLLVKTQEFKNSSNQIYLDKDNFNESAQQLESLSQPQALLLEGVMYYLAIPSERDRPSLYRKVVDINDSFDPGESNFANAVEVLPGVLNLQFKYGVNTNNELSADTYLDADDVDDWTQVVSVRVFMLVETETDRTAPESTSTYYFGRTYGGTSAPDKRIRREFSTTVTLRNRALGLTTVGQVEQAQPP